MIEIEHRAPRVEEYISLRDAVDWLVPAPEVVRLALANSVAGAVAVDGEEVVGMGRVVGDSALYSYVVDLVVHPTRQGRGIGRRLLSALETQVVTLSATGLVQLVADDAVGPFYDRCGYRVSSSKLRQRRLVN